MSKRSHDEADELFESSATTDRKSRFVAIFTPSYSSPKSVQSHLDFKTATHRMLAWRKPSSQKTLSNTQHFETYSDDDGEQYAGKKLEKVLSEMNVVGTVVVARWYGGVLLGPARFEHIANTAKDAIQRWKATDPSSQSSQKKAKVDAMSAEEEQKARTRLVKVLGERDQSIEVLRGLLAEKTAENLGEKSVAKEAVKAGPDYAKMPLAVLKRLEVAKDSTIALILKKIDEAEADAELADLQAMEDEGHSVTAESKSDQADGEEVERRTIDKLDGKQSKPEGPEQSNDSNYSTAITSAGPPEIVPPNSKIQTSIDAG